jgi:hypothetical protein
MLLAFCSIPAAAACASSTIDEGPPMTTDAMFPHPRAPDACLRAPIPACLIASTFDCLALVPAGMRLRLALAVAVAHAIGCSADEMPALIVRIRAAAIVLADPRWLPWAAHFKACDQNQHRAFDVAILHIIATLPLTSALRFAADDFFAAVLVHVQGSGHG